MYKNLSIIVAIAQNFAIGKNNELLMHIPGDLKRFKAITSGSPVIMGRNTLLSLPKWPLPNRRNIVISDKPEDNFEGCEMVSSIDEAIACVSDAEEAFVMGGGMIYKQFYPLVNKLYLTIVHRDYDADTFFPVVDFTQWTEVEREDFSEGDKTDFAFSYVTLLRK